jgi:NADPH-dependent curcumin reductase CurA
MLEEMIQEILVKEYREIIEKAVDAYAELIEKGKYSQLDANALLYDVPLENWPNMVRRLLEEKNLT